MEEETLAWGKKNAATQGRTIVFVDESGLSERPTRVRTWAPRGQTPVLQYHFNWHQLSVMAGLSVRRFYFRLFPGAIRGPQVIEFLKALRTQLRRPLLVGWPAGPSQSSGPRLSGIVGRCYSDRASACLRPGVEPRRVPLGVP